MLEPEFFFKQDFEFEIDTDEHHRKLSRTLKREIDANRVQYNLFLKAVDIIADHVTFPDSNLPNFCTYFREYDEEYIKQAAAKCRETWGLSKGPIDNLIGFLELHGIIVSCARWGSPDLSGFSFWANSRPYVFINNHNNYFRCRFDVAHELAHLVLHKNYPKGSNLKPEIHKKQEKEANAFASYFLMPPDSFGTEVLSDNIFYFIELKKRWKTSISSMIYNCHSIGRIDENKKASLYRLISYHKWNKVEPLDDQYTREKPDLLARALDLMFENKVTEPREFAAHIGLPIKELEILLGLPSGFFKEKQTGNKVVDIRLKKVIP
jgi:Zn-dependent peptidase ImmA (M78 family)